MKTIKNIIKLAKVKREIDAIELIVFGVVVLAVDNLFRHLFALIS